MDRNEYPTSNIYEWAAIKLAGGPEPNLETCMTMGKMTVMVYKKDELPEMSKVKELMPSNELIALYNKYKHDVAFKLVDKKEKDNGERTTDETV